MALFYLQIQLIRIRVQVLVLCNYMKIQFNSDGHTFHQSQQNEQSPLMHTQPEHILKEPRYMTLGIHVLAWDKYENIICNSFL